MTRTELAQNIVDEFKTLLNVEIKPDHATQCSTLGVAMEYLGMLKDTPYAAYMRERSGVNSQIAFRNLDEETRKHLMSTTFKSGTGRPITTRAVFEALSA